MEDGRPRVRLSAAGGLYARLSRTPGPGQRRGGRPRERLFRSARRAGRPGGRCWPPICKLTLRTIRWTLGGRRRRPRRSGTPGGGVIACFWHGRIALAPACWPQERAQSPKALISLSPDGAFIARAMAALGFPAIRGSQPEAERPEEGQGRRDRLPRDPALAEGRRRHRHHPRRPARPGRSDGRRPARPWRGSRGDPVLLVGLAARPALNPPQELGPDAAAAAVRARRASSGRRVRPADDDWNGRRPGRPDPAGGAAMGGR